MGIEKFMRVYAAKDAEAAVLKETENPPGSGRRRGWVRFGRRVATEEGEGLRICKKKSPTGFPEGRSFVSGLLLEAGVFVVCAEHRLFSFQRPNSYRLA